MWRGRLQCGMGNAECGMNCPRSIPHSAFRIPHSYWLTTSSRRVRPSRPPPGPWKPPARGPSWPSRSAGPSFRTSPDKERCMAVRVGIKGFGRIGRNVVRAAVEMKQNAVEFAAVNDKKYDPAKHHIISNASCTTNCLVPVVKVVIDNWGFRQGFMTTVHSYTNDQQILDLPHKDLRRARAAALSIIPTTTGAAKATSLVIPEVKGKIDGIALRVPTPDVSIVDLTAVVEKRTTIQEVNAAFKQAAQGALKGILEVSDEPLVSADYIGSLYSSVVDSLSTNVIDGTLVHVSSWYDNEMGYSARCLDLLV